MRAVAALEGAASGEALGPAASVLVEEAVGVACNLLAVDALPRR